jgi:arsenate reductase
MRKRVLFICIHNAARSQMAEAWLNHLGGDRFAAESAGIEPGTLNPLVVQAMHEVGIDLSGKRTKSVFDLFKAGRRYDYVITVCDPEAAERCPVFPGMTQRLHWGFPDPSRFQGSEAERLAQTRLVRDAIRQAVAAWLAQVSPP